MNIRKNSTLMRKLILYFLVIIALMFSLNAFSIYRFEYFYNSFYGMLRDTVEIQSISTELDSLYACIESYAHSGSQEYTRDYAGNIKNLFRRVDSLKADSREDPDVYYRFLDIQHMLETFNERSDSIIRKYDIGTEQIYINQMVADLSKIKGYVQDEMKDLQLVRLRGLMAYYYNFWEKIKTGEGMMYILTVLVTVLCLGFAFEFSRQISVPIHQLVLRLKKVAKGDLDVEALTRKKKDEIGVLIDSFNYMISQIKSLIVRTREKADVERQLKEQEIKNLEISNLLNQSELNFLQSQINPHFLFNTLNSIATLADIEEAGQTKRMIESISNILRYNLRKLNEKVTLREELDIIHNYLAIQKMRYGNRIEYVLDIDERMLECTIPSMIIQPFVENSIMHGLESKEGQGLLELSVYQHEEAMEIMVRDNGIGMTREVLELVGNGGIEADSKRGIGVLNVMRRLEMYYGRKVVSIESILGIWTTIKMTLPISSL